MPSLLIGSTALRRPPFLALFFGFLVSCSDDNSPTRPITVSSVSVSAQKTNLAIGDTVRLLAVARDASGSTIGGVVFQWSSSSPTVASVSAEGLATGLQPGSTIITASSGGKSTSVSLAVAATPVASVVIAPASATGAIGDTLQFSASVADSTGAALVDRHVAWSVPDTTIATVDADGRVVLLAPGSTIVSATSEGVSGTAPLTVLAPAAVASLVITPSEAVLEIDETREFRVALYDSAGTELNGRPVDWASKDPDVASVTQEGVVTAVAAGTTWVSAASGEARDSAEIRVLLPFSTTGQSVAAGYVTTCALTNIGDAYCWGIEGYSGIGVEWLGSGWGPPRRVRGGHRFVEIDNAGSNTFVALTADGSLYMWGSEQRFDGSSPPVPEQIVTEPRRIEAPVKFRTFSSGSSHICAIALDDVTYCWGLGSMLGNGSGANSAVPVKVAGDHRFVKLSASSSQTLALTEMGELWAWGIGYLGVPGLSTSTVPVRVAEGLSFIDIAAGGSPVALGTDGTPYTWGYAGPWAGTSFEVPTPLPGSHKFRKVASGGLHALALKDNGELWAWGHNEPVWSIGHAGGALGDGTTTNSATPVRVAGGRTYEDFATGHHYSVAIGSDGNAYGWGWNRHNQAVGYYVEDTLVPTGPAMPRVWVDPHPPILDLRAGQSGSTTVMVKRFTNGFNRSGSMEIGAVGLTLTPIGTPLAGVSISAPSSVPAGQETATIQVTVSASAPQANGSWWIVPSAPNAEPVQGAFGVRIQPPPQQGQEFACPTETTVLPEGYHCMAYEGLFTAGKFSDAELHGTWVDEVADVCLTWHANGQGFARYKAGSSVTQTPSGKWGAMINLDGSRFQNERYWMIFTATADPQTNILAYDSQTKTIVNWDFQKKACPF